LNATAGIRDLGDAALIVAVEELLGVRRADSLDHGNNSTAGVYIVAINVATG
jgi:hypothetical protein